MSGPERHSGGSIIGIVGLAVAAIGVGVTMGLFVSQQRIEDKVREIDDLKVHGREEEAAIQALQKEAAGHAMREAVAQRTLAALQRELAARNARIAALDARGRALKAPIEKDDDPQAQDTVDDDEGAENAEQPQTEWHCPATLFGSDAPFPLGSHKQLRPGIKLSTAQALIPKGTTDVGYFAFDLDGPFFLHGALYFRDAVDDPTVGSIMLWSGDSPEQLDCLRSRAVVELGTPTHRISGSAGLVWQNVRGYEVTIARNSYSVSPARQER